ncbi:KIF21B, partial [Symbiodinium sp. KB8]
VPRRAVHSADEMRAYLAHGLRQREQLATGLMPTTAADQEHQFLLEDFLNTWLTEDPERLPGIRESKAKSLFKVPDEGPDSAVLQVLCHRYAMFPAGTKRKVLKDWASTEAGTMRAMANHALLLTRKDVDQVIDDSLNEAMQQDPNSPCSSLPASETDMDVDMVGDSDAPEEPMPLPIPNAGNKAMRPPIEAVQPELPSDLLPGLASQIQQNLSAQGPDDDLVQAQRQVREKTRIQAAAKVLSKDAETKQDKPAAKAKGRGRGRGRGRRQQEPKEQEPSSEQAPMEQEPSNEQAPKEQEPSSEQAPKEQEPSTVEQESDNNETTKPKKPVMEKKASKSTPEDSPYAAQWQTKALELKEAGIPIPATFHGQTKSFTIPPSHAVWHENQLYVIRSMVEYQGIKINNKNPKGSTVSQRKHGGWARAWELAQVVAGWVRAS